MGKSELFEYTNLGCTHRVHQVITTGLLSTQSDCYFLFIIPLSFLPRIFRKKKRTNRSLSCLLDPRASRSWLHGSIFGEVDSLPSEDLWMEGIRSLGRYHCHKNGDLCFFIPWWDATSEWQSYSPCPRHSLEMPSILMERVKPEIKILLTCFCTSYNWNTKRVVQKMRV